MAQTVYVLESEEFEYIHLPPWLDHDSEGFIIKSAAEREKMWDDEKEKFEEFIKDTGAVQDVEDEPDEWFFCQEKMEEWLCNNPNPYRDFEGGYLARSWKVVGVYARKEDAERKGRSIGGHRVSAHSVKGDFSSSATVAPGGFSDPERRSQMYQSLKERSREIQSSPCGDPGDIEGEF